MTTAITERSRATSQQRRLLRHNSITHRDAAAFGHFGVDPAIGMAEPALQGVRNRQVALRGIRVDVDGGTADNSLHNLESDIRDHKRAVEQVELVPGRPALDIEVGAEAQGVDGLPDHVLDGAKACQKERTWS